MFKNAYKCIGEFNGTWKRPLAKLDNETQTYIMFEKKTQKRVFYCIHDQHPHRDVLQFYHPFVSCMYTALSCV